MPDTGLDKSAPEERIWRFGTAEFDEARRELRVGSEPRNVEAKPLAVLRELLLRAGEVATKKELLAAVWPGQTVEQSLTTAIAKLRTALGEQGRSVIEAVHGTGYRISVPIELYAAPDKFRHAFGFRSGDTVPNRPQWQLERLLGDNQMARDVWLARHHKTGECRVFKFADAEERLEAIKREAAISRILYKALGDRPDLLRIREWNFKSRPFFIESPFGGDSLPEWLAERGGISSIPLAQRIAIVARVARTAAAAHDVGVLHQDIKPSNVLMSDNDELTIRLVDFGSGRLTEAARIEAVTVVGLGLTAGGSQASESLRGTLRYMAPEVIAGGPPTIAADVYALGILLYQMIAGDLDRVLGAGWETDVTDPLLREDVREAASSDPKRRLSSALILAERLDQLDIRRAEKERRQRLEAESSRLAWQVERTRLRRPWLILGVTSLALGFLGSSGFAIYAMRERGLAVTQQERADHVTSVALDTASGLVTGLALGLRDVSGMQLPVAEGLLDQAEKTLTGLEAFAPDDRRLRRLEARSLTEFAVTYMHEGDLSKAINVSNRAAEIQRNLLLSDPTDTSVFIDVAETQRWLGDIRFKKRDLDGATIAYEAAISALQQPMAVAPDYGELQQWLARDQEALGDIQMKRGKPKAALAIYKTAAARLLNGLSKHPSDASWRLDVSTADEKQGDTLDALGDAHGSLAAYQADLSLRQSLLSLDPQNTRWQRDVAVAEEDIGDEQRALKNWQSALTSYQAANALDRKRSASDPTNIEWRRDTALSEYDIGITEDAIGNLAAAEASDRKAVSIMERVTQESKDNAGFQHDLMVFQMGLSKTLVHAGNVAGAKLVAEQSVELGRRLNALHPDDAEIATDLKEEEALQNTLNVR